MSNEYSRALKPEEYTVEVVARDFAEASRKVVPENYGDECTAITLKSKDSVYRLTPKYGGAGINVSRHTAVKVRGVRSPMVLTLLEDLAEVEHDGVTWVLDTSERFEKTWSARFERAPKPEPEPST